MSGNDVLIDTSEETAPMSLLEAAEAMMMIFAGGEPDADWDEALLAIWHKAAAAIAHAKGESHSPPPSAPGGCGHSACSQHYIDTGSTECIQGGAS